MDELSMQLAAQLTALAAKQTASTVTTKINAMKNNKNVEELRTNYDAIITDLLSQREEAVRIAMTYKAENDRLEISDEDIVHLHATVDSILDILKETSPGTPIEQFERMKNLISVDTLKCMQLLGFNYKAAIGEPLTNACANFIKMKTSVSKSGKPNSTTSQGNSRQH